MPGGVNVSSAPKRGTYRCWYTAIVKLHSYLPRQVEVSSIEHTNGSYVSRESWGISLMSVTEEIRECFSCRENLESKKTSSQYGVLWLQGFHGGATCIRFR